MIKNMQDYWDELSDDEDEQELCRNAEKAYNRRKRKEHKHSLIKQYSGEKNELLFQKYIDFLYESRYLQYYKWLSYNAKTEYDFIVQLKDGTSIYFDVVGTWDNNGKTMLNCSHKDYKAKLKEIPGCRGYLAFILNDEWRFIQISRHLPKGDLRLTSGRNKHIKKANFVFMNENILGNYSKDEQNLLRDPARNIVNMTLSQVF